MAGRGMMRLVLVFSVLSSLLSTSSAQTCKSQSFTGNRRFAACLDLPQLSSYLHWSYNQSTGKLDVAYLRTGVTSANTWVAWAIHPNNNSNTGMIGAQAFVANIQPNGTARVLTSSIESYQTTLAEGNLSFPVLSKDMTYQSGQITIFATLTLWGGITSIGHLWQDGQVSGSTPQPHAMDAANLNAKQTLDLLSGQTHAAQPSPSPSPAPSTSPQSPAERKIPKHMSYILSLCLLLL